MMVAFILKAKIHAMGKQSLVQGPFGFVMKWFGIVPIDRSKNNNIVSQTIEKFNNSSEMIIIVPPSGTRNKVQYWKTGFYYIALGANVPISLGFIDYGTKSGGLGPLFYPTGDIEADMIEIKKFYEGIVGKYPDQQISQDSPDKETVQEKTSD